MKNTFPRHILLDIYQTLVCCHLNYGTILWGHNSNRISNLQRRALRLVLHKKYNSGHTDSLYSRTRVLKFSDIYTLSLIKFFNNFRLRVLPEYLLSLKLSLNSDESTYPCTRNADNIHQTRQHSQSLSRIIPSTINSLKDSAPLVFNKLINVNNHRYGTANIALGFKTVTINSYSPIESCNTCYPCTH